MLKLGILVDNLGPTQLASALISSANDYLLTHPQNDFVIFRENIYPNCMRPNFAIMDTSEVYSFDGVVLATNISNAEYLSKCPGPVRKIFYVCDPEWHFDPNKTFEKYNTIYKNPDLEIVCRSSEHAFLIESLWGRTVDEVLPPDIPQIFEYLEKDFTPKPKTYVEGLFYDKSR